MHLESKSGSSALWLHKSCFIMVINLYNNKFAVFLAAVSPDMEETRQELIYVLQNAGINPVDGQTVADDSLDETLQAADCSIHLLGASDIYSEDGAGFDTPAGKQFRRAKQLCGKDFKMLIWNPAGVINAQNVYIFQSLYNIYNIYII